MDTFTDFVNYPIAFMPECAGRHGILEPLAPFPWRQVRRAHTAAFQADAYLSRARLWDGNLLYNNSAGRLQDGGFHRRN